MQEKLTNDKSSAPGCGDHAMDGKRPAAVIVFPAFELKWARAQQRMRGAQGRERGSEVKGPGNLARLAHCLSSISIAEATLPLTLGYANRSDIKIDNPARRRRAG